VFFTDFGQGQRLTAQSGTHGQDLYKCEIVEEAGKLACHLTDLTPANAGGSAEVQNLVLGAGEDGSYVYFVANGVLSDGAERGDAGTCGALGEGGPASGPEEGHKPSEEVAAVGRPRPGASELGANGVGRGQVAELQRARMLTAMVREISERGGANVSVAHVVARSGVSRRMFYEIFDDREDCFLAAFDEAMERVAAVVVCAYEQPGSWQTRMRAGLIALLEFLECDPARGRLLIVESLAARPGALERRQSVLARIIPIIDQGRTETKAGNDPPALTAEGILGGVLSVLHARLLASASSATMQAPRIEDSEGDSLLRLVGPLMGMIVLPYLGPAVARKEIERPMPKRSTQRPIVHGYPLQDLPMRFTYRTMRVLMSVAEHPGSSNRAVGESAGIGDQGQTSKLLARLHRLGLIENEGGDPARGEPNAWTLTTTGKDVHESIASLGG
jgi:AcrR family transcriptional regulator